MQKGFGLVELLVALAIGMVLMLGLGGVFSSMRQSSVLRQKLSTLQDSERMAMLFAGVNLRGAGVYNALSTTTAVQFPASAPFAAGQPLVGSGGGIGSDSFSVRFTAAGSNAFQGCSAQPTANDVYTEVFGVAGGYLTCTESDNTAGSGPTTVNLVSGVSGMNVLYGVDTTGDGSADEYLTGDQVTTASLWRALKTIQVTLILANPLAGQPGQPATVSLTQTVLYLGPQTW